MSHVRLLACLAAVVLTATAAGAQALPGIALPAGVSASVGAPSVGLPATVGLVMPVAQVGGGVLGGLFDLSVGIGRLDDYVNDLVIEFEDEFSGWANALYASLFLLQFLLIGATMVVRGPFALASARPVSALGPFANFFFFLIAGAFGYLLVANSFYVVGDDIRGWVPWLYDFFSEAGQATGCERTPDPGILFLTFDKCNPDELASVGMRLSGVMMALAQENGASSQNGLNTLVNTFGASSGVFGAFSVLAIQMALTQIAFKLAIVAAPLFLATFIFRPISGISTGFLNFILYLGVKLAVLYLVAGLASFVAQEWLRAMAYTAILSLATGGGTGPGAAGLFSYHLSVLTVSLLLLGLTLYLPARIAGSISGHFSLDLNALLFRGEMPTQID